MSPPLRKRRCAAALIASVAAVLFAAAASCANRDALREIVQNQCIAHWRDQHDPAPCVEVHLDDAAHAESGYAVLADRKGGAHFLLIPTRTISGIESHLLRSRAYRTTSGPRGERTRDWTASSVRQVPVRFIGLAVNPLHARGQDQLHIHIECLRPDVYQTLASQSAHLSASWSPLTLAGSSYWARRIPARSRRGRPVQAARRTLPGRRSQHGRLHAGGGRRTVRGPWLPHARERERAAGELLLDSSCAALQGATD